MKVSVLIDTYNHERFIEHAITSVLEQDMPMDDVEILVVDDGSTDRTPEIARRFEPRVRLLRKPNGGQASAFNWGFAQVSGQIVAMLDGDDWWERQKLRLVLDAFRENPEIGAIGNGIHEVDSEGKTLRALSLDRPYKFFFHTLQEGIQFRSLMTYMGTSRLAIRRSVLERILPVPEDLIIEADEYLATLSVAISGGLVLDQPLTNYRYHPGNLYQYGKFSLERARRKSKVLHCLTRELPGQLHALGVSPEIVAAMLGPRKVEAERLRLTVEGGMPWETLRVESEASRMAYKKFSIGYRLFHSMVLALTLTMPPKWFYRVQNWYADRELHRFRELFGKPILADTFVQGKAVKRTGLGSVMAGVTPCGSISVARGGPVKVDTTDLMRQDWDERARKDAFHYIASWRKDWTPESFFQSGEEDYLRLVASVFDRWQWEPEGKSMLELGCGAGRMTRSFAHRFSRVYAFDISTEMLGHAKTLFPEASNVEWILGNGVDLSGLGDETVDFAFSYIVLQHMPEPSFAVRYIREMLRVLKPGGMFLFQFNSVPKMTMNWKGRLAWGIVDFPWALGFRKASQGVASLLGLSPEMAGKSWRGASLDVKIVRETIETAGAAIKEMAGEETPMTWCCGLKLRTKAQ